MEIPIDTGTCMLMFNMVSSAVEFERRSLNRKIYISMSLVIEVATYRVIGNATAPAFI